MLTLSKEQIKEKLNKFVWGFKVGDNITYNLDILFNLYKLRENLSTKDKDLLNKPIVISLISIIEAIFFDWICLLDGATNHFPKSLSNKQKEIKTKLKSERQKFKYKIPETEEIIDCYRIRNYKFSEIIDFIKEFELFGKKDDKIYANLAEANFLRNRIHIFNWFQNFETDELKVFTEKRLNYVETLLEEILEKMVNNYPRPW